MSDIQIKKNPKVYDVCIVGSGAGGGMASKILSEAGMEVALLEAGPDFDAAEGDMFKWPHQSPRRGANTHKPFGEFDAAFGGWEIEGEPYTHYKGTEFDWFRSHMLGGRTNHWGRISLRFGQKDFKRHSIDGLGADWPIGYEDVKPYYDKIDRLIGLYGSVEGLENEPDGIYLTPPKPRAYELLVKRASEQAGVPVIPSRMSILTEPHNGRPPCHYCSQCGRGCSTNSNFSSGPVLIRPAMKSTGKLELFLNAMVREVLTDSEGKASGVSYINKDDGMEYQVKAKVVILAASACSSARILLNSKSAQHPNGLGNSSDIVGHYLHDSTGASRGALIPSMIDMPPHNEDGTGGMHMYMPWWLDNKNLDFARGYHIEFGGGKRMPGYGFMGGIHGYNSFLGELDDNPREKGGGGYGAELKNDYRRLYGAFVGFSGRGEAIARHDNFCEIDPNVVDQWGIPVLKFNYTWSDHEVKQARHMQDTFEEIIDNMGGVPLGPKPGKDRDYGLLAPGRIIHEVGTSRMGDDPKTSVLNKFNQAHEVNNLFVVDGGAFVSQADKNPTWTILALAWRASDYIIEERKRGNV